MRTRRSLLLLLFSATTATASSSSATHGNCEPQELIVWNVGQGQWVTLRDSRTCWHFDTGGERVPWREISSACAGRLNPAHFSHWDWDHVSFMREAARKLAGFCIRTPPGGETTAKRRKMLDGIPECPPELDGRFIAEIYSPRSKAAATETQKDVKRKSALQPNALSRVFLVSRRFLVPGDSTSRQEKGWSTKLDRDRVSTLVLGHHGSRTSTSEELLKHLPALRFAIASARRGKYGHPHPVVVSRLKRKGVALVSTESWGSVHIALGTSSECPRK